MKPRLRLALVALGLAAMAVWQTIGPPRPHADGRCVSAERPARLRPDYVGLTIPPNIAPLNCVVAEPGTAAWLRFTDARGDRHWVAARRGVVDIPLRRWRAMLAASRGGALGVDVYVRSAEGRWSHFAQPPHQVAAEPVDSYLCYRYFQPAVNAYVDLGIRQRNVTNFGESWVVHRDQVCRQCVNCHTPAQGNPDRFLFHTRPTNGGSPSMVVVDHGQARVVDTRGAGHKSAGGYASWHPNGQLVAFSFNKIHQFIWEASPQPKDAIDISSRLGTYDLVTNTNSAPEPLNQPGRLATFPCWSPDGKWLYYASAERPWAADDPLPLKDAAKVRYDLMRCAYDAGSGAWGEPELVLDHRDYGLSLIEPRVSPDGRWLLFVGCEYGSFPIFQRQTDLWLLDLSQPGQKARPVEPTAVSRRDSWHSWSSNGRWIVCASKRDNGTVARAYLRYVDADGQPRRPFVLPQRDPTFYDRCLHTYNVPEFQRGPSRVDPASLAKVARSVGPTAAAAAAAAAGPSMDYHGADDGPRRP